MSDQHRVRPSLQDIDLLAKHQAELERRLEAVPPRQPTALAKLWDRLAAYLTPEQLQAEKERYKREFREQMEYSRRRSEERERIISEWHHDVLTGKLDEDSGTEKK